MKLFRVLSVPANKFSAFLRYTGGKIGLRTRGYVVRGNKSRIIVNAHPFCHTKNMKTPSKKSLHSFQ